MCGVAAIFPFRADAPRVDVGELEAIRDHMVPRGPDGAGSWIANDGRIGLAHRRLARFGFVKKGGPPRGGGGGRGWGALHWGSF